MNEPHRAHLTFALFSLLTAPAQLAAQETKHPLIELNDNGAWSWFMDERAVVQDGKLIVGSVRSRGAFAATSSEPDWGNVEISVCELATGNTKRAVLHQHFEQDDHNSPALLVLPDKRLLALYSKHGQERRMYCRISRPGNPLAWSDAIEIATPGREGAPFRTDNVTYNNTFLLPTGRIYDFYRGVHFEPNYMVSDDSGRTWKYGGHLFRGKGGYSPYLRYAFDGKDTIHFIATEDHPRNYDNSVYHGFLRDGLIHFSDGKVLGPISETAEAKFATWDLTRVFVGDPDHVCWIDDVKLDREGRPHAIFSVKRDGRGTHGRGGQDIRFHYGFWDGASWQTHEMAYAGSRLYRGEDDYTGLAALDRKNPSVVYLSTNANPVTGTPLVSAADNRRHHELFRGTTPDAGKTWHWEPITSDSKVDNLRPIVPSWDDSRTILVWMRGTYRNNRGDWTTAVVATILSPPPGRVSE